MPPNPPKLDDLVETAIEEIKKIQSQSKDEHVAWLKQLRTIPSSIPVGDGRQFITTSEGIYAIHEFGRRWRSENPARREKIGEEEVEKLAVRVFGQVLASVEIDNYPGETRLKTVIKDLLDRRLEALGDPLTHYVPCQVFENDRPPFDVGPVRFMPRDEWLDQVQARAGKSLNWIAQVRTHWQGRAGAPPVPRLRSTPKWLRMLPLTTALKAWIERRLFLTRQEMDDWLPHDIVDSFAAARWIAVVQVTGRERLRSRECAEIAVRIALDTLGLPLRHREARWLRGPGDETRPLITRKFSQADGQDMSYSSTIDLPRLKGKPEDDEALLIATADLRRYAGIALSTLVETSPQTNTPILHRRWIEAMYWFGQAVRQQAEFVGLVDVGISLDILAKGGKTNGILQLCCRLFNMKPGDQATSKGDSLRKLVEVVYDEGRSQISHGGRFAIMQDLPISRETALLFAREVFGAYVDRLDLYVGSDDYESFLAALPTLTRPETAASDAHLAGSV